MFAFLAPAALKLGAKMLFGRAVANARQDFAAIPPKVKLALVAVMLLAAGYFVHQHVAHKRIQAADAAGYARARAEDRTALVAAHNQAIDKKRKTDAATAGMSQLERQHNDQKASFIRANAAALRVWRPAPAVHSGRSDHSGAASGSGGYDTPGGPGDPATVAVDWPWLVDTGEQCDLNRSEVLTWRSFYDKLKALWPSKPTVVLPAPASPPGH